MLPTLPVIDAGGSPIMKLSEIPEHAPVVGAAGVSVGVVDRVDGRPLKLARMGDLTGRKHFVDIGLAADIENGTVRLSAHAAMVLRLEDDEDGGGPSAARVRPPFPPVSESCGQPGTRGRSVDQRIAAGDPEAVQLRALRAQVAIATPRRRPALPRVAGDVRWKVLAGAAARPLRLLWASTEAELARQPTG